MSAYVFTDTTEASPLPALSAEAVWFDGHCLDTEITGFRTLNVQGREVAEKEVDTYETGGKAGEAFRRAYYKTRTITVTYQIMVNTAEQFRESYNQLNRLLHAEQARLIFNDEPDKYFIATKASNNEVDAGLNCVTGAIDFLCADPRKYSTVEKVFTAASDDGGVLKATIVNNGTDAAPISYKITHNHENGYIGIVSEYGAIQLGKVQEADGENYQQNETLLSGIQAILAAPDDHGTNYMHPDHDMGGELKYTSNSGGVVIHSMGTGAPGKWCGGMRTISIPQDSEGIAGAKNFWCYLNWWFQTAYLGQTGEQSIAFLTADNKVICGYSLYKADMSGNTAALEFWLNGKIVATKTFTPSGNQMENPFDGPRGHQDIRKEGDKVTYYWFGSYIPYTDPAVKDMVCTRIQIAFTQYYGRNIDPNSQYVTRNCLRDLKFQKMNVDKWKDVPNRYSAGDVITIDGETTKIYRNGMNITGDEVAGSTYFSAPPGETVVEFRVSDFCTPAPDIQVSISEVYL